MESQTGLGIIIGIGCFAMISLAMMIIAFFNLHRKRMLEKEARIQQIEHEKKIEVFKAASEAEEKEREKIANNIHDEIIPTLSTIFRSLDKNVVDFENNKFDPERIKNDLKNMEDAIKSIRTISHDLIPNTLLSYGLVKALEHYAEQINGTAGKLVDFENTTAFRDKLPLSKIEERNIYRMCLEIFNNLFKHSGYRYLKVTVENTDSFLIVEFMHDGKGITDEEIRTLSQSAKGLGLKSLRSRAILLNANITYTVEEDAANVTLSVPFKP